MLLPRKGSHRRESAHILCAFRAGAVVGRPYSNTAGMAELVDAPDSKSGFRKEVGVRFPLPAPQEYDEILFKLRGTSQSQNPRKDTHERWVCDDCGVVHYQNPLIVVGCVAERNGKILLCKRSIEPRYGYWTVPAGFMELGRNHGRWRRPGNLEEAVNG